MPVTQLPSIDNSTCRDWTLQDIALYNALPYFFAKHQVERKKTWKTFQKFLGKNLPWQKNSGKLMKVIIPESSPHLRQQFTPNTMWVEPAEDIVQVRERLAEATLYWHDFTTPVFHWEPAFVDFMGSHIVPHTEDLNEKMERAQDLFIRTNMFHQSPRVWLPNGATGSIAPELVDSAVGIASIAGNTGKTAAVIQALTAQIGNPGNLSIPTLLKLVNTAENALGLMPYKGSALPGTNGTNYGVCIVCSSEAYMNFMFDPWLKDNSGVNFNFAENGFSGNLVNRVTFMQEAYPIRFDRAGACPAPETIELNPNAANYQETMMNPDYVNAPYEVAWLFGAPGYDGVPYGPPPSEFQGDGVPKGFGQMKWSGEIQLTKDLIIPCTDGDGNTKYKTNNQGRYLQLIATQGYGIVGVKTKNVIPIIFKRTFAAGI